MTFHPQSFAFGVILGTVTMILSVPFVVPDTPISLIHAQEAAPPKRSETALVPPISPFIFDAVPTVIAASPSPTPGPEPTEPPDPTATPGPTATPTPSPVPTATPTPTPEPVTGPQLDGWFSEYASRYSVDRELLRHIAICESNLHPQAVNGPYGGMFQFTQTAWRSARTGMQENPDPDLRFNAEEAIKTAAFKISVNGTGAWPHCGHTQ